MRRHSEGLETTRDGCGASGCELESYFDIMLGQPAQPKKLDLLYFYPEESIQAQVEMEKTFISILEKNL